jgi:hypothetical protein
MRKISSLAVYTLLLGATSTVAQGISTVQIEKIFHANALSGIVTFGNGNAGPVPGALVEECSPKWAKTIADTHTDGNGSFKLPITGHASIHYLRISMNGANPLLVRVKLDSKSHGLVLNLQPST